MPSTATRVDKIATVCVAVGDQDKMVDFYVNKLGLELKTDVPFGNGYRWVEVGPADGETTIALAPPPEGKPTGTPEAGTSLHSADIDAYHAKLRDAGVDVDAEVNRMGDPVPPL